MYMGLEKAREKEPAPVTPFGLLFSTWLRRHGHDRLRGLRLPFSRSRCPRCCPPATMLKGRALPTPKNTLPEFLKQPRGTAMLTFTFVENHYFIAYQARNIKRASKSRKSKIQTVNLMLVKPYVHTHHYSNDSMSVREWKKAQKFGEEKNLCQA